MDKQLKRLSRTELLELFIEQSQVLEETKEELEKVKAQCRIMEVEAGSIAEAAMRLNGVFETAQKAADQYLYSLQAKTGQGR